MPTVTPATWQRANASTKKDWQIWYRFYDDRYKDQHPNGKLVPIRRFINDYSDLPTRQAITAKILEKTIQMLKDGYNPHTKKYMLADESDTPLGRIDHQPAAAQAHYLISPSMPFGEALSEALARLKGERETKARLADSTADDIKVTITGIRKSAHALGLEAVPVAEIERRHIIMCMEQCEKDNERWSENRFNKYRANLSILYREFCRVEAVKGNIIRDIEKEVPPQREDRTELTVEERIIVAAFLDEHYPEFLRFLQIFFHSSSRETELMRVQGKDVDLQAQRFYVVVKKGRKTTRQPRVIKNVALPYWSAALAECGPDQYVFAKGLLPGDTPIKARQITRRWANHVKNKKKTRGKGIRPDRTPRLSIKVEADFYSLKHTNMDEVAAARGLKYASSAAGHTNERTSRLYAQREIDRHLEVVKEIDNEFAIPKR